MKKTVTRQFPDAVINTIYANGVSLTKKQKGAEVNLFFDDTGTPRCAEIYSLDEETSEHAEIGLFFDGKELVSLKGHKSFVNYAAFSKDLKFIIGYLISKS